MSENLYRKIINEIRAANISIPVFFTGFGEALIDKNFLERIRYASKSGIKILGLATNGNINLRRESVRDLLNSGLKYIFIDVDADTSETYSRIRVGGNFQKLISNIELLIRENKSLDFPVRIILGYLFQSENKNEFALFKKRWDKKAVHLYFKISHTFANTIARKLSIETNIKKRYPCHTAWGSYFITWEGKIPICCHDYEAKHTLGDANKSNIFDIWNTTHRKAREYLINEDYEKLPLCKNCNDWKMYEETFLLKKRGDVKIG